MPEQMNLELIQAAAASLNPHVVNDRLFVAVWRDETDRLYVLPPCGRCREFIRQIDDANLDTLVILGSEHAVALRELLPYHEWPRPLD
jgi:cytidine deaminase